MFTQQSVYILGIFNLILAGIAVVCVTQAEDHPEYFSLVYIAISIFMFYMGTVFVIIILQIVETCQEQRQRNHSSFAIETPILTTQVSPQLNSVIDNNMIIPAEPNLHLSRSQTLPLILSSYSPHQTSSISTSSSSSTLKDFKTTSSEMMETSTRLALLPKFQQTFATTTTIHRNYQSFAFTTNEHRYP